MKCPLCLQDEPPKKPLRVYHYYGPSPRNDGGPFYIYENMRKFPGVDCFRFECTGDPALHGKRDWNVTVDWAADAYGKGDYVIPRPNIFWMSDTHMGPAAKEYRYEKAKEFDKVFCAVIRDVVPLRERGISARWLPYAADPVLWRPTGEPKEFKVGFLGHVGHSHDRLDFLNELLTDEFWPFDFQEGYYFEDAVAKINTYQIVLNHCIPDFTTKLGFTNMRVFEVLAAGGCLLTRETPDLPLLGLEDGKHLLTYRTVSEAKEKLRRYVKDRDECHKIGMAGRDVVVSRHTYVHRVATMLDLHPTGEEVARLIAMSPGQTRTEKDMKLYSQVPIKDHS